MIITAGDPRENDETGMLVSSFNTVTLFPDPVVTFNIKLPSSTYSTIEATGHFSVLAPESVEQAKMYSRGIATGSSMNAREEISYSSDSIAGLRPSSTFRLECRWLREKSIVIGDHIVMVGQVLSAHDGSSDTIKRRVLIYSNGQYRYAGDPVRT